MTDDRPFGRRRSGLQKAIRARIAARRLRQAMASPAVRHLGSAEKKTFGRLLAYQGGARRPRWSWVPWGNFYYVGTDGIVGRDFDG